MSRTSDSEQRAYELILDGAGDTEIKESAGIGDGKLAAAKKHVAAAKKVVAVNPRLREKFETALTTFAAEQQEQLDILNQLILNTKNPEMLVRLLKRREDARILQARIYVGDDVTG